MEAPKKLKSPESEKGLSGKTDVCPYLGLSTDADSVLNYPSPHNVCYHLIPAVVPVLSHQENCCLTAQYNQCPLFNPDNPGKLPEELIIVPARPRRFRWSWVWLALAVTALVFGILLVHFQKNSPGAGRVPTPTHTAIPFLLIRDATSTKTSYPTQSAPSKTAAPTSTPTPEVTRLPHTLGVVIGVQDKFIIHKVASGESIQFLASRNNTTANVIKSINHNLVVPIWIDSIIVIPLDRDDPGDLPAFEPYEVADENTSLRAIAKSLNVDLAMLSQYNDLSPDEILKPGEWVLIPRERTYWYR